MATSARGEAYRTRIAYPYSSFEGPLTRVAGSRGINYWVGALPQNPGQEAACAATVESVVAKVLGPTRRQYHFTEQGACKSAAGIAVNFTNHTITYLTYEQITEIQQQWKGVGEPVWIQQLEKLIQALKKFDFQSGSHSANSVECALSAYLNKHSYGYYDSQRALFGSKLDRGFCHILEEMFEDPTTEQILFRQFQNWAYKLKADKLFVEGPGNRPLDEDSPQTSARKELYRVREEDAQLQAVWLQFINASQTGVPKQPDASEAHPDATPKDAGENEGVSGSK